MNSLKQNFIVSAAALPYLATKTYVIFHQNFWSLNSMEFLIDNDFTLRNFQSELFPCKHHSLKSWKLVALHNFHCRNVEVVSRSYIPRLCRKSTVVAAKTPFNCLSPLEKWEERKRARFIWSGWKKKLLSCTEITLVITRRRACMQAFKRHLFWYCFLLHCTSSWNCLSWLVSSHSLVCSTL